MRQILGVADYNRRAGGEDFFFQRGLERHLRADAGRIANSEADAWLCPHRGGDCAAMRRHSSQCAGSRESVAVSLVLIHILNVMFENEQVRAFITVQLDAV